jgi:5-methylcytosine-specific restriction endonuclease McrA
VAQRTRFPLGICRDCGTVDDMDWWRATPGYWQGPTPRSAVATRCRPCYNAYTLGNYHRRTGKSPRQPRMVRPASTRAIISCTDCGTSFGRSNSATRCRECSDRRRSTSEARRRAAVSSGDSGITWRSVGERDGWLCHLCAKPVPQRAGTAIELMGATVDHLIPIAADGRHEWANVALAHRRCNISRGTRGIVQLRLAA